MLLSGPRTVSDTSAHPYPAKDARRLLVASLTACTALLSGVLAPEVGLAEEHHQAVMYEGEGLRLAIEDERVTITYSGELCIGAFEGALTQTSYGTVAVAEGCEIELQRREDGGVDLRQGEGCTTYHGARCSLSGTVYPTSGAYMDKNHKPNTIYGSPKVDMLDRKSLTGSENSSFRPNP